MASVQLHLMRCNVKLYSQFLPLALCRHGGGISTWHLPQFSIFQNGISRRIGEVHCLMDQIFLSATLSLVLVLAIDVFVGRRKCLKTSFAVFFIETLQNLDWKICVRGKERVVSEHTTTEVGKVFKPLFRKLEDADV